MGFYVTGKRGTVRGATRCNPVDACVKLYKAMKGLGTEEAAITAVVGSHNMKQRQQIRKKYIQVYKKDLLKELDGELSFAFAKLVAALMTDPEEFTLACIHRAVVPQSMGGKLVKRLSGLFKDGLGKTEYSLMSMVFPRTNKQLEQIKEAFMKKYEVDLDERIASGGNDLPQDFCTLLLEIVNGERVEEEEGEVDLEEVEEDVDVLVEGEAWEDPFQVIMQERSFPHLRKVLELYNKETGRGLEELVDESEHLSLELKETYKGLLLLLRNEPEFYADRLKQAIQGAGTDDETLIRVVVLRSEVDLLDIMDAYEKKYEISLVDDVAGDTSGDYKELLNMLLTPPPPEEIKKKGEKKVRKTPRVKKENKKKDEEDQGEASVVEEEDLSVTEVVEKKKTVRRKPKVEAAGEEEEESLCEVEEKKPVSRKPKVAKAKRKEEDDEEEEVEDEVEEEVKKKPVRRQPKVVPKTKAKKEVEEEEEEDEEEEEEIEEEEEEEVKKKPVRRQPKVVPKRKPKKEEDEEEVEDEVEEEEVLEVKKKPVRRQPKVVTKTKAKKEEEEEEEEEIEDDEEEVEKKKPIRRKPNIKAKKVEESEEEDEVEQEEVVTVSKAVKGNESGLKKKKRIEPEEEVEVEETLEEEITEVEAENDEDKPVEHSANEEEVEDKEKPVEVEKDEVEEKSEDDENEDEEETSEKKVKSSKEITTTAASDEGADAVLVKSREL